MKIQCAVCTAEEASVFCCADEAALCDRCDRQVHCANLLAGKHHRFSLLNDFPHPLCDVCQEKRGFMFCQQDRAILCRNCDVSIHNANSHTMKHSRFLLSGIRLSSVPIAESAADSSSSHDSIIPCNGSFSGIANHQEVLCTSSPATSSSTTTNTSSTIDGKTSSSSISEYLIKLLPSWHVEDFLLDDDAAATTTTGYYEADEMFPSMERDGAVEGLPIWVPNPSTTERFHGGIGYNEKSRVQVKTRNKRHWNAEMCMVPAFSFNSFGQISTGTNKSRPRN